MDIKPKSIALNCINFLLFNIKKPFKATLYSLGEIKMIRKIVSILLLTLASGITNVHASKDIFLHSISDLQNVLTTNAGKPFTVNFCGLYQPGAATNYNTQMQPAANIGNFDLNPLINLLNVKPNAFGLRFTLNTGSTYALWLTNSNGTIVSFNIQWPAGTPNQTSIPTSFIDQLISLKNRSPFIFTQPPTPPTMPVSGSISLKTLDTYLLAFETYQNALIQANQAAPQLVLTIESSSWYGTPNAKITTPVQSSLQQYASPNNPTYKKVFAYPLNMNQYFQYNGPLETKKQLYIGYTLNGTKYNTTINERPLYSPLSKYIFKIPNGTNPGEYIIQMK